MVLDFVESEVELCLVLGLKGCCLFDFFGFDSWYYLLCESDLILMKRFFFF